MCKENNLANDISGNQISMSKFLIHSIQRQRIITLNMKVNQFPQHSNNNYYLQITVSPAYSVILDNEIGGGYEAGLSVLVLHLPPVLV